MDASFAAPGWSDAIADLDWGTVFAPLRPELLWVLETTIRDEAIRVEKARELAMGMAWFGEAYAALCVTDSHKYKAQHPRFIGMTSNLSLLVMAARGFTPDEQQELLDEVSENEWPCASFSQAQVLEMFELAVMRWYVVNQPEGGSDLLLSLQGLVGFFYVIPQDKRNAVEKALAFH